MKMGGLIESSLLMLKFPTYLPSTTIKVQEKKSNYNRGSQSVAIVPTVYGNVWRHWVSDGILSCENLFCSLKFSVMYICGFSLIFFFITMS